MIKQLRERRATLAANMQQLHSEFGKESGKKWGSDQQAQWEAMDAEIQEIDNQIAREQRVLDLDAAGNVGRLSREEQRDQQRGAANNDPRAIFNTWLRHGDSAISQEQWAVLRNTMSTTTPAEGGYTVPAQVASTILDELLAFGSMRRRATILRTATGQSMSWPTSDGTSEVGEILAENAEATGADPSFGTLSLGVYKYSSKVVAVPIELLQDSSADIEGFIRTRLRTRLGRITEAHYATGTGSSQPHGLLAASGGAATGKTGTTGQTLTVTYDDLIDLIHSIDPAYRANNPAWMMHDSSLKVLRKLKDSANRPVFVPGYDAQGLAAAPGNDRLLGYPLEINQNFPVMAANAKSIAFGDFSTFIIRDCMDIMMFRFTDSAYAKKGQVGFLAMMRTGSRLIDVGGSVKVYANSAT